MMEEELLHVILAGADPEDIEAVILNNIDRREAIPHQNNFNLMDISDERSKELFRFQREHITQLRQLLRLPNVIRTVNRVTCDGATALCMLLRRLAYPNRLCDLTEIFGKSAQSISEIILFVQEHVEQHFGFLLNNLNEHPLLNDARIAQFAEAVHNKGGALDNCWGFIDGTARPICRPSVDQEEYYSGHKRIHCVEYQSVIAYDRMIYSLKGGYPGRRHDARIFRESNMFNELQQFATRNGRRYVLYGDDGYAINDYLICPYPFRGRNPPEAQQEFNRSMKTLRIAVEWGFQKIISPFAFVDFKKNQKLLQDVEKMYKVSVILTNCHSCLYGNETAQYFGIDPPLLQIYLGA